LGKHTFVANYYSYIKLSSPSIQTLTILKRFILNQKQNLIELMKTANWLQRDYGRMARGGHEFPKVSLRRAMPYPSTPCRFRGGLLRGRAACGRLLSPWMPQARPVWKGVSTDSLKFHPGPPCPTLLRPAGGPPPTRPYCRFWGGPPAGQAACGRLLPPWIPDVVRACPSPYASGSDLN
jgi:hypothetical protein